METEWYKLHQTILEYSRKYCIIPDYIWPCFITVKSTRFCKILLGYVNSYRPFNLVECSISELQSNSSWGWAWPSPSWNWTVIKIYYPVNKLRNTMFYFNIKSVVTYVCWLCVKDTLWPYCPRKLPTLVTLTTWEH